MKTILEVRNLEKIYLQGDQKLHALNKVNMKVQEHEFVAIMGASGSGKSTLLNLLGCLDRPTAGEYYLRSNLVSAMDDDQLADIRNKELGFVFQSYNLLPRISALQNVELPLLYAGIHEKERRQRSEEALLMVGLKERIHHRPNQLSGGQQQRVAIARALINNPALILADEPTGNLDTLSSVQIMALFQKLNQEGRTIVIVTHEEDIAHHTKRIVLFRDGNIIKDTPVQNSISAEDRLKTMVPPDHSE